MKRPRPYVPLEVRCQVAERQLGETWVAAQGFVGYLQERLDFLLTWLRFDLGVDKLHLDHNPALGLRPYNPRIKNIAARYTPNANDPAHLLYRDKHAHLIKTTVRGDGAQRSDIAQITRERRRLRPAKVKRKIRSRGFPNGRRPFPKSRGFQKRTPIRASRER